MNFKVTKIKVQNLQSRHVYNVIKILFINSEPQNIWISVLSKSISDGDLDKMA